MKQCVIIFNPKSGNHRNDNFQEKAASLLLNHHYESHFLPTERMGHAEEIVESLPENVDLVIVVGGDGTYNEAINGNYKRTKMLEMAIIPTGTTNDFANMIGYGKDKLKNLELLLKTGVKKEIDVPMINNRIFNYVAAIGEYADVACSPTTSSKQILKKFAYVKEFLKLLIRKPHFFKATYTIDDITSKEKTYSLIVVSNTKRIAGIDDVYGDVKLNDGMLEVMVSDLKKKREIIMTLLTTRKLDQNKARGIYFDRVKKITFQLSQKPRENWGIDGERLSDNSSTFEIGIAKRRMPVRIPNKNVKDLFIN